MPPALAAQFTTGELAALRIVADEIARRGDCRLPMGAVAARAGVSETTARNALRGARREELLTIEARPRPGRPNLTNIVRVISAEWLAWIARGASTRAERGGCKKTQGTDNSSYQKTAPGLTPTVEGTPALPAARIPSQSQSQPQISRAQQPDGDPQSRKRPSEQTFGLPDKRREAGPLFRIDRLTPSSDLRQPRSVSSLR
jgi:hypothetical protein